MVKCLKDFEQDLNKCSKCGLCQSACPLFKINPNECAVSKGKFIMLHGVTLGNLELSKNINKYLDMCLKCGKCNKFCPSGIDVCRIISAAKYEYMRSTFWGKLLNFLMSKYVFGVFLEVGKLISKPFRKNISRKGGLKLLYFKGCINKICPRTDSYIAKIFKNVPIDIIEPNFDCCGLPLLSEGNLERFEQVAKSNLELADCDYDYLITDCASCESTILGYPDYLDNITGIAPEKSINWGNLIALKNIKFKFKKPLTVTFHKPCHLKNDVFLNRIFENCENVNYVEMDNYDSCCGFAGSFGIKNRELSLEISKQKAHNIKAVNADYVITTCPSCVLGLKLGLHSIGCKTKVVTLLEFLAMGEVVE
ncbi:MAG: (Fe-S)-binding protein [Muribaculaceae bacterium]|nr:(Fe-S)-binding protein [Muribaculaceae bacterium]